MIIRYKRIIFDSCASTNDEAKKLIREYNGPVLVSADTQSAGKGTKNRSFACEVGCGAYFSLLVELPASDLENALLTPKAAVAVAEAIEEQTDLICGIKWVNDVCIDEKKVCGILTETVIDGSSAYAIVGIGVNTRRFAALEEIPNAAAIDDFTDTKISIDELIDNIAERLLFLIRSDFDKTSYISRSFLINRCVNCTVNGNCFTAVVRGFNDSLNLIVEQDGERITLISGEATLSKTY